MAGIALAALCAVAWPRLRLLKDKLDELLKTASHVSADALTIDKLDSADPTAPDGDNNMVSSRAVVLLSMVNRADFGQQGDEGPSEQDSKLAQDVKKAAAAVVQRNITYLQCTEEEMSGKGGQFEILSHVNFGSLSWTGLG